MGSIWDWADRVFIREHQGHGHDGHHHDHDHNRYKEFLRSRSKPAEDKKGDQKAAKQQPKPAEEEKTPSK
ncbi:MAG: hypothetical protein HPY50_19580 [Firmicutes bacterium]|nr:hypothetical protein [Bacillota bacterium]